jgi:hypothetical protein
MAANQALATRENQGNLAPERTRGPFFFNFTFASITIGAIIITIGVIALLLMGKGTAKVIKKIDMPVCDVCEEMWLPSKGPARDNPREFNISERKKGKPGLRCGKCKNPRWDWKYLASLEGTVNRRNC